MTPPFCPNCGELVPEEAAACPHCGSCEETGWSETARYESLGIPLDSDDDREEAPARRLDQRLRRSRSAGGMWWWTLVGFIAYLIWLWVL